MFMEVIIGWIEKKEIGRTNQKFMMMIANLS